MGKILLPWKLPPSLRSSSPPNEPNESSISVQVQKKRCHSLVSCLEMSHWMHNTPSHVLISKCQIRFKNQAVSVGCCFYLKIHAFFFSVCLCVFDRVILLLATRNRHESTGTASLTAGPDSSASFSSLMMAVVVPENTVLPPHDSTRKETTQ